MIDRLVPKTTSTLSEGRPILIYVGYAWGHAEEGQSPKNSKGLNKHWDFLRNSLETVTRALEKYANRRKKAQYPLRVDVRRLRSRHGGTVIGSITRRMDEADVLVFDITGDNPNVLFELGYAIARKGVDSGRVYVFSDSSKAPSDLRGLMLTTYIEKATGDSLVKTFSLQDGKGFQAAFLSTLREIAIVRGMLGDVQGAFVADV